MLSMHHGDANVCTAQHDGARHRLGVVLAGAVVVFVGIAGVTKLVDLRGFADALSHWPIPRWVQLAATFTIPVIEFLVAGMWLANLKRTWMDVVLLALLVGFTAMLGIVLSTAVPPSCACITLIERHFTWAGSVRGALARNAVLLALLGVSAVLRTRATSVPISVWRSAGTSPRAFTVLETCLVILIVGILAALLVPTLSKVRAQGWRTRTLSYLGSNAATLAAYTIDHRDAFPAFMNPEATSTVLRYADGASDVVPGYFSGIFFWNRAIADRYYNGDRFGIHFFDAEQTAMQGGPGGTPFLLPCAYFASPEFWNPDTRSGADQFRGVSMAQCLFPSAKSLLVDIYPLIATQDAASDAPFAFVDGHAQSTPRSRVLPGYDLGEGDYAPEPTHRFDVWLGLHTLDGIRGRDVR